MAGGGDGPLVGPPVAPREGGKNSAITLAIEYLPKGRV